MKKNVRYILQLLIFLLLGASIAIVGIVWYQSKTATEHARLLIATRLGLASRATWQEIEQYLDCSLVKPGMTRQQVENNVRSLGDKQMIEILKFDNDQVRVRFLSLPITDRYYSFQGEFLSVIERVEDHLDGPVPVYCG